MKLSASIRAGRTGLPLRSYQLASLAALVTKQDIAMTIPRRYGKTEAMRQAGLQEPKLPKHREKKQHKLKGLRP